MRVQSSGHSIRKAPDLFIMAAGVRAIYSPSKGDPLVVRVQFVDQARQRATVRDGDLEGNKKHGDVYPDKDNFVVPIHALLPPLKVYRNHSKVFNSMHSPFKWRVVDTLENYAAGFPLDPEADPIVEAILNPPEQEDV